MNPEPECNLCQTKPCDATPPQCSSRPYESNKIEIPLKYEDHCGQKNCIIFGGHDTAPLSEYRCKQKPAKINNENKNSLGSPIGLVASSVNFKAEGKAADIMQARYATYLKAFARLHLNEEKSWDSSLLDDVMKEGLDLYTSSQSGEPPAEEAVASDIYMPHEEQVLREFELSGFKFQIELMPKYMPLVNDPTELGAKGDGLELTMEDIVPALRSFLRKRTKYGLLKIGTFYAMIWRTTDAYFVFDACGRKLTDFQADRNKGVAMLMCFKSLDNIRHLINNLSNLQATEPLIIRELKLVKVVTPQGHIMQIDYGLRNHQYEIVSEDYAYLKSDLHLTLNKQDLLRNRSGLSVAVAAIVSSKIDHPATWDHKTLNRIICFGVNLYQARWMKCANTMTIDVNEFPANFTLGQFHINIEIQSHYYNGTWHCVPGFKDSELANAIRKAFEEKHQKLILQINYQIYAIWKKHEFIYLLDPYRHRILGKQNESKIYNEMEKSASVRMFRAFETFMNVLNHILLDSNRTSHFFLHIIKVKNMQALYKGKPGRIRPVKEPQLDDYGEILSINEHICFEEAEDVCKVALGEISDYEDDDLKSDVVEIELRTSSSEEELLEEEEAAAGTVGEMEDIESSSSGEEGGGHKMKAKGNKGRGKGNNAPKRKEAKKGGSNKNKKGKETNDNEKGDDDSDYEEKSGKKSKKTSKEKKVEKTSQKEESDNERAKPRKANENDNLNKDFKETPNDNQNKNKDKDARKDKTEPKALDESKDWEESSKKDTKKNKDRSKDKKPRKEKDPNTNENIDKEFNPDTSLSKDKVISKDKESKQDKPLSQDKDLKEKLDNINKGKINETVHSESKPDPEKSETSPKDTNKEIEIEEILHKFVDDKESPVCEEDAKDERKDKERTEQPKQRNDETEKCLEESVKFCSTPNPNRYPGYFKRPADMAVVGSESGSYESICKLFHAGFKVADRVLLMTPWGNFVIFLCKGQTESSKKHYYLFDGCTCNFNRFQHFDLSVGTAGLICFENLHNTIEYIKHLRQSRRIKKKELSRSAEDICKEYHNKSFILRV